MEQQRLHQEERVRRALERAKADPKKKVVFVKANFFLFSFGGKMIQISSYSRDIFHFFKLFFKIMFLFPVFNLMLLVFLLIQFL